MLGKACCEVNDEPGWSVTRAGAGIVPTVQTTVTLKIPPKHSFDGAPGQGCPSGRNEDAGLPSKSPVAMPYVWE
jgi:hypothetical protein